VDPKHDGLDDNAKDPYDRWVVRFPGLRRAVRAHRFAIAVVCVLLAVAAITPTALKELSRRGASTPSAAAAPPRTTSTTTPSTSTTSTSTSTSTSTTTPADPSGTGTATTTTTIALVQTSFATGIWDHTEVTLTKIDASDAPAAATVAGQLTAFVTSDPSTACLTASSGLTVEAVISDPHEFLVLATTPADCTTADFIFTTP
jgi:cytoskeletal protein RodZ